MELLLILIYLSICYVVFKSFQIPSTNGRSLPRRWAGLFGVFCFC